MSNNNFIDKKLILPDAIVSRERCGYENSRITKIAKFWRFRYFAILIFFGSVLLLKDLSFGIIVLLACFLIDYFISRCKVTFFKIGLYFFNSSLSGVFFLLLVVIYREVPGIPDSLCSVHSTMTCTLFPLPFLAISYSD